MSRMTVRACSTYTQRGGQTARIQEVVKHPGWSIRSLPDFDIALGLLDGPIKFSHTCHSVDLPNHAMFPPFDDAWVAGWGGIRPDGIVDSNSLFSMQVYYARLIPRPECTALTERFGIKITENFICLEQRGHRAPCTRDTGSPAVSDGVLWGLASWGIRKKCGTERYPAVFSYIGSPGNLFFITNATRYLQTDPRQSPYPDRIRSSDLVIEPTLSRAAPVPDKNKTEIIKVPARTNAKKKIKH